MKLKYIKFLHRWLGLFASIQLLLWTLSGLFFTIPDIKDVRGDQYRVWETTNEAQRLDQNITKALLAYNAGLSRVRNWDRSFQDLPLELYVEAVPFPETRKYIKKIFISALMYGHLYERKTSLESTGIFFPNLSAN